VTRIDDLLDDLQRSIDDVVSQDEPQQQRALSKTDLMEQPTASATARKASESGEDLASDAADSNSRPIE
jgi:hypothetical protein